MLEKQVNAVRRDLSLLLQHLHTLPFILGTPHWFLRGRHRYTRPFSELDVRLYPLEHCRIIIQAAISFIPATLALALLLVTIFFNAAAKQFSNFVFDAPLRLVLQIIQRLLNSRFFAVRSPIDQLSEQRAELRNTGFCVAVPKTGPQEVWIHVNGICEQGAMVDATCTKLKQMTGRLTNAFVNTSNGAPFDLLECILGRTLNCAQGPAIAMIPRIVRQLALDRRVILVAHSQGAIIVSNVVKRLVALSNVYGPEGCNDDKLRVDNTMFAYGEDSTNPCTIDTSEVLRKAFRDRLSRVEVYTFGCAADEFEHGPFVEHFAAELDFVARIGALHFSGALHGKKSESWNGDVFMLRKDLGAQGHLMKEMLLPAMQAGVFGQNSVFWRKYCDNGGSEYVAVSHHLIEDEC